MTVKTGLGQDSHAFLVEGGGDKKLILGGIEFEEGPGLKGNSDSDVVMHAVTNAVSGITSVNILGEVADTLCAAGIRDSAEYLKKALAALPPHKLTHVSISIEAKRPKLAARITEMRRHLAALLQLDEEDVGITATSGEELTSFGQGKGIQALAVVTAEKL
jgi:2-C-methyl-D-erythritol 2,4-cyclodiphosphate synthase